jgi:sulfate adenylyltransferase subunit 1
MATGASTAELAIILIDARKGILTQSRRHAYIASLLGIRHLVAAVNKMDLVDFSEEVYQRITTDLHALVAQFGDAKLVTIPVSALEGDNVVEPSARMPWYSGPTLLEHLEQVPVQVPVTEEHNASVGFRLPIQRVIRPDQNFRGFAGQIVAGSIRPGDTILALPSGRSSRVASISTFDGDLAEASAPQSIALTLEDELDISRGDLLVSPAHRPQHATEIEATLVWFDGQRLEPHKPYLLKHGAQTIHARVAQVLHRTNIHTLEQEAVHTLAMNEIGTVEIGLTRALFFDAYSENRSTGSFILIDPITNATVAAAMIRRGLDRDAKANQTHRALLLRVPETTLTAELEQLLLDASIPVVRTRVATPSVLQALLHLGIVVLVEAPLEALTTSPELLDATTLTREELLDQLRQRGVLPRLQGDQR